MSLLAEYPLSIYALALAGALSFLYRFIDAKSLRHIPTVGSSDLPIISYWGAYRYVHHAPQLLQEGYNRYKGRAFKIPLFDRWLVLVTGSKLIEELQKAPDEYVSITKGFGELVGANYIFGEDVIEDRDGTAILRERLTRNIGSLYHDIHDEVAQAFEDLVPAKQDEWVSVSAPQVTRDIVARTSSRIFIGYPICRDPAYLSLTTELAEHAAKMEALISLFPPSLKPLVGRLAAGFASRVKVAQTFIQPVINERMKLMETDSDYMEKPNDFLQWLLESAVARRKGDDYIVRYLLTINFIAIDSTTNAFTQALLHLAAHPEYMQPLREEVDAVVKQEGWTKNAISSMHKVDSFMRESLRYTGIGSVTTMRMAMKDFTFSDGTFIPQGTIMCVPSGVTHYDEQYLTNAKTFDPWRYVSLREEDGTRTRYQLVTPSTEYVPFGGGRHACPGRFFAANEMKTMMAYIVMNYDVKLDGDSAEPPAIAIALAVIPNPAARVLFRKRQKTEL